MNLVLGTDVGTSDDSLDFKHECVGVYHRITFVAVRVRPNNISCVQQAADAQVPARSYMLAYDRRWGSIEEKHVDAWISGAYRRRAASMSPLRRNQTVGEKTKPPINGTKVTMFTYMKYYPQTRKLPFLTCFVSNVLSLTVCFSSKLLLCSSLRAIS